MTSTPYDLLGSAKSMKQQLLGSVVCWFLLLCSTATATASLMLRGTVIDSSGAVVVNAKVTLVALDSGASRTTVSNATGEFSFSDLSPGKYRLSVQSTGFATAVEDVSIGAGEAASVRIQLNTGVYTGPPPPPPPNPPVYNAIFSPVYPGTTTRLYDGKETKVRFFVGPSDSNNGLSPKNWSVNPKILNAKGIVPLSVTMNCIPCATNSVQTQPITYSAKKRRSSEATFSFIPSGKLAAKTGVANLVFSVSTKGVELDRIVVEVGIGESAVASPSASPHAFLPELPLGVSADLTLIFSSEQSGGLTVQLDPANAELIARFNRRHVAGDQLRRFSISLNESELQLLAFNAYVDLRGIVDQYDKPVQKALPQDRAGELNWRPAPLSSSNRPTTKRLWAS